MVYKHNIGAPDHISAFGAYKTIVFFARVFPRPLCTQVFLWRVFCTRMASAESLNVMQQAEKMGIMVAGFFSVTPKGGNMSDIQPQLGMMIPNASDIHLLVNEKKHFSARINPLLIGGLEHGWIMTFPQYMGMSYSQLTFLFVRGVGIPPTRHFLFWIFNVRFPWFLICVLQWISQEYPKNGYIACRSLLLWVA